MQLLIEFLPIIIFFVAFKVYGMYVATAALMVAMALQIAVQWFRQGTVSKMLLVSGLLVALFGSATLLLKNPIFIQWKPTIVNWLFAAAFLGSHFIGKQTIIQRIMGHAIDLPAQMWRQLNIMWTVNFLVLGGANLYVVYNFDEATWVNFKLFGMLGLTLITAVGQTVWIAAYTSKHQQEES
jgi:intracellular septation protein